MEREKMIDIKPLYTMYDLITMPEYQAGELLFEEVKQKHPDIQFIKRIYEHSKFHINWKDIANRTALHWASWGGHVKLMSLFLENPYIDVNAQDDWVRLLLGRLP